MAIRVSGLVSGLDTDSIVQELVSAYSKKKDKDVKAQTKLEWKMDAWKELNKKVNSLYKKLGNMKLSSYYNKKTTTISDSTKATVSASNSAINGTQTLKITEVASAGYLTGAQIEGATASTTLGELGLTGDGTIAVATNNGAKSVNVNVSADMKISDFVNKLKDAGVSASFDSTHGRMYISAKDSGEKNDFSVTAADANGLEALKKLGIYTKSKADEAAYAKWDKYAEGAASDADIKANFKNILDTISKYQGEGSGSIKELEAANADLKTHTTKLQAQRKYATAYMSMKDTLTAKNEDSTDKLTEDEQKKLQELLAKDDKELEEADNAKIKELQEKLGLSAEDLSSLKSAVKTVASFEADVAEDAEVNRVAGEVHLAYLRSDMDTWLEGNSADIEIDSQQMQANADEIAQMKKYINDNQLLTGSAPAATLTEEQKASMTADEIAAFKAQDNADRADALLAKYKYIQDNLKGADEKDFSDYVDDQNPDRTRNHAVRNAGTDATIELNGVQYTSASNSITVNGLTVTALQKTAPGEQLTISTQADVQGMYDSIKDFLKEYNALIKEMDELYNADSAKGYDPLTDDEKEAMTDKEIEKWEEKIKKSILRRDDTLSTVMNLMTSTMAKGITLSDGKKYSLSSFGIKTQGYLAAAENEGYVYHIDGDSEDEISSGNTDKLLAALQQNPDMVQEFFQKLSDDLYTRLDKKMQTSTMNSKFSIYNDKKMKSDYDNYTTTIKKWEDKTSSMEDYYYKKFSAMEKALSTLQNSTSALSGLLGS